MAKLETLAISCGGTGGHFNPGLSVARAFKAQGGKPLLLLGGIHSEAQEATAQSCGIEAFRIDSSPMKMTPRFIASTSRGVVESRCIMRTCKAQALLAMGSFASLPPALAAMISGVPMFLHEGNARIGRANRALSRMAEGMALSFQAVNASGCHCRSVLTGMPLRPELLEKAANQKDGRKGAIEEINHRWQTGFSEDSPVALIFGGSLGASSINKGVPEALALCGMPSLQAIHLSGAGHLDGVKEAYSKAGVNSLALESCQDMHLLYEAADMVVCRSGGSTVSELALFGKYAVLIPYPHAADAHQDDNAAWLAAAGGADVVHDKDATPERLAELLKSRLGDVRKLREGGLLSKRLASPDASQSVIGMIEASL